MAARFASLAALIDVRACFFCKIAWVFTFLEETGDAFTMRGAVFTARFPASLIVFSASGLTLMLPDGADPGAAPEQAGERLCEAGETPAFRKG